MTENITELIAEARDAAGRYRGYAEQPLFRRLADALEQQAAEIAELRSEVPRLHEEITAAREGQDAAIRVMNAHTCGENAERAFQRALRAEGERDRLAAQIEAALVSVNSHEHTPASLTMRDILLAADPAPFLDEVRAQALEDAAGAWHAEHSGTRPGPYSWLCARAAALRTPAPTEGES